MLASIPWSRRKLPVWLLTFFSPSIYFFSFLLAHRFHVAPSLPAAFYVVLYFLIFAGALLFCLAVSWAAEMRSWLSWRKVTRPFQAVGGLRTSWKACVTLRSAQTVPRPEMTLARKMGLAIFTSLGLLLQFGLVAVILRAILITLTAYPQ